MGTEYWLSTVSLLAPVLSEIVVEFFDIIIDGDDEVGNSRLDTVDRSHPAKLLEPDGDRDIPAAAALCQENLWIELFEFNYTYM